MILRRRREILFFLGQVTTQILQFQTSVLFPKVGPKGRLAPPSRTKGGAMAFMPPAAASVAVYGLWPVGAHRMKTQLGPPHESPRAHSIGVRRMKARTEFAG